MMELAFTNTERFLEDVIRYIGSRYGGTEAHRIVTLRRYWICDLCGEVVQESTRDLVSGQPRHRSCIPY